MNDSSRPNIDGSWVHEHLGLNNNFCDIQFNPYTPISTNPQEDSPLEDLSHWSFVTYEFGCKNQITQFEPFTFDYLTPAQPQDGLSGFSSTDSSRASYTLDRKFDSDNYWPSFSQSAANELIHSGPIESAPSYVDSTMSFLCPQTPSSYHSPSAIKNEKAVSSPVVINEQYSTPPPKSMKTTAEFPLYAYTCPHCPRSFSKRFQLNIHVQRHTKPFVCPIAECETKHGAQRDLYRHIWAHHEEYATVNGVPSEDRPCPVQGCGKVCRKDNLRRHLRKVHGHGGLGGKSQGR